MRRLPDSQLELVAQVYMTAIKNNLPPVVTVSEALGIPYGTAARQVLHARRRGFLPPWGSR